MSARVLVIDDDPDIRRLVHAALEIEGYEIRHAVNGRQGLEVLGAWTPDLILLDIGMPVMDGREFLKRYREDGRAQAKVVIFTAAHDPVLAAEGMQGDALLAKPFDLDDLYAVVARLAGPTRG